MNEDDRRYYKLIGWGMIVAGLILMVLSGCQSTGHGPRWEMWRHNERGHLQRVL